jgi:hypothetical protein
MIRSDLITQVAEAIKQTPEQAEDTINSLLYIFNKLKKKSYSFDDVCNLIVEAANEPDITNPDVQYIVDWLRASQD